MVEIEGLSNIGFGGHLISANSPKHREALVLALRLGCNILDTSANYVNGESEELIGQVLAENPQFDAFIVTKSGIVVGGGPDPNPSAAAVGGVATSSEMMEPDALRRRIDTSLERLRRDRIDCYLLHNPEVELGRGEAVEDRDRFYARVQCTFEFFEEMVERGTIRYYGISSNTFHLSTANPTTISLHRVLEIARSTSSANHFRFIEFPFNLAEPDALRAHHDGVSLIELARSSGLITLSNRPLNCRTSSGALRLALYPEDAVSTFEEQDRAVVGDCLERISRRLRVIGESDDPLAFGVVRYVNENWMSFDNPEAAAQIFQEYLYPFLLRLYGGTIPQADLMAYEAFYEVGLRHGRRVRRRRTMRFFEELVERGELSPDDRPLPVIACEQYLRAGINCVLVGMRKARYVEIMKALFSPGAET